MQRMLDLQASTFGRFVLVATILIAATVALGLFDGRYSVERTLTSERVVDEPSRRGAAHVRGERSATSRHVARLPERGEELRWLRLSVALDGELYDLGPDAARPPLLATWFTRPNGARQNVAPDPLHVGMQRGVVRESVRSWPAGATEVVAATLPRAARGELAVHRFDAEIVALSTRYCVLLALLAGGWALLGAGSLRHVRPRSHGVAALAPLALVGLICAAVMFSSDVIENVIRPIVSLAHGTRAGVSLVATFKVGHGVAFALLTVSLLLVRRRFELSIPRVLTLVALLAFASEAVQLHLPARTPQVLDLLIDGTGAAIGLALWWLIGGLAARRAASRRAILTERAGGTRSSPHPVHRT